MEELKEKYTKKAEEMKEKYHDVIYAIAEKHGVDVGVGFDMLKAVCRGGDYLDGVGVEVNLEELKADYEELVGLSEAIANS